MVGKIHIPTVGVCCHRVFVIFKYDTSDRQQKIKKLKKLLRRVFFPTLFFLIFLLILYVLYVTNQKPSRFTPSKFAQSVDHNDHSKYHYGIVVDCGSSGSRAYLYYWPPHNGNPDELLRIQPMVDPVGNPIRMKIRPGISSLVDMPGNATDYLKPLLDFASQNIPSKKHKETPLYILATAGMRMLPEQNQNAILNNLRQEIPKKYQFHFTASQADIISGKQEGIYMWIAINYILGRFDHSNDVSTTPASVVAPMTRKRTVGILEMGGASVQIAYEIAPNVSVPNDLVGEINLGCDSHQTIHKYRIYVTTFLGFGTNAVRRQYVNSIIQSGGSVDKKNEKVYDPCLPKDMEVNEIVDKEARTFYGSGLFSECQRRLTPLLNATKPCPNPPCSLNGVHQPAIYFDHAEFYGFAEFWYSTDDVLRTGGEYDGDKFDHLAKEFCETRWAVHQRHYSLGFYPKADEHRFKYQCFKSAWMTTVLHEGFRFPRGFKGLTSALFVRGKEIQWTLGAILYRTRFMPLRLHYFGSVEHSTGVSLRRSALCKADSAFVIFCHSDLKSDMRHHGHFQSKKASYGLLWLVLDNRTFYGILIVCFIIVVCACIIYSRRLRRYSKLSPVYSALPLNSEIKIQT